MLRLTVHREPLRPHPHNLATLAESLTRDLPAPIDPEKIAAAHGIVIHYGSFPQAFEGLLLHEKQTFVLVCNTRRCSRGTPRNRYTLAHELGHYFIPSHREALCSNLLAARIPRHSPWGDRFMEEEADRFAAHLLMPAPRFSQLATTIPGTTLQKINRLAQHFGTSITATAYRFIELDLLPLPSAVLLWDQLGLPAGRRVSTFTADIGPDYCVLTTTPPVGSATAKMIEHLGGGMNTGESHLMDWFIGLSGYEPEHQIHVREEAMALGNHGWLTLIHPAESENVLS